jgi:hypothetical protein
LEKSKTRTGIGSKTPGEQLVVVEGQPAPIAVETMASVFLSAATWRRMCPLPALSWSQERK